MNFNEVLFFLHDPNIVHNYNYKFEVARRHFTSFFLLLVHIGYEYRLSTHTHTHTHEESGQTCIVTVTS